MSLNGQNEGDPRYGRVMVNKSEPGASMYQKQRAMGAIESFTVDNPGPQVPKTEYKMYERNNIIASSKFATPKQVETIAAKQVEENDVYVQCAKPQGQVGPNASPTQSLSGSSQHSGSPRTSIATNASAIYENIDYYGGRPQINNVHQPYFHQMNQQEALYRKAQPQVPTGK